MIRKTLLGLAAATAIIGASASTASAGVHINLGFGGYGYGYAPVYGGYYGGYHCKKVFVGYKKVWNGYGWYKKPIYKKRCW
jgi:hypothetical protein